MYEHVNIRMILYGGWEMTAVKLGRGVLTWNAAERRSDRYGTVFLMNDGHTSLDWGEPVFEINEKAVAAVDGKTGKLVARVVDARDSTHIGDIFRGVFPATPEIGEEIELGIGTAFTEEQENCGQVIGLTPADGRSHDWLDITALYRAHEQLVELVFMPGDEISRPEPVEANDFTGTYIGTDDRQPGTGFYQVKESIDD